MSLRTPTPLGYGTFTRFLTLEVIKVALTKDQMGTTDTGRKRISSGKIDKHSEILQPLKDTVLLKTD
jgi:hypothetical protein